MTLLRFATYNIHKAVGTDGKRDPEDLQALYEGDGAASSPEETDLFTQRLKLAA